MAYAKRLTKERLIQEGFTEITKEGRLFKGDREVFPRWNGKESNSNRYLCIFVSQRDAEGHLIKGKDRVYKYTRKDGSIGESISWNGKLEALGLHRVMWAWFHGEVPEGMVVDHINNKHSRIEDYHLDNLQLLTPKENVMKERICNVKEIPCKLSRPRSYYEEKLAKYEAIYEQAKANHDAEAAHKQRTNIAQTKARMRYYDNHNKEVNTMTEYKKDLMELASWKKFFKENGNKTMWHECIKVEKVAKVKKDEAAFIVKHALDVLHGKFGFKHE